MPIRREQVAAALQYLGDKADLKRRYERMVSLDQPQDADAVDMALEMGGSIVPGVGQALAARDFERARRADDKAGMAMAGASVLPLGKLIGALKGFDPVMREIDVYHGSPHRFEPEETLTVYRGENTTNKGGNYWTGDPEFARQFTQSGLENEIKRSTLLASDVYTPPTPVFAGDAKGVDAAIAEARRLGKSVVRFSEGKGQPDSFYVVEKTALGRTGNPLGAFNASKIGTGEGAQAYGHGIYLAEKPSTAEIYRRALAEDVISVDGRRIAAKRTPEARNDPETIAVDAIVSAHGGQYEDPFSKAIERLGGKYGPRNENFAKAMELAREWRGKGAKVEVGGNLYTADLPDEMVDRMLDWDKPLSEQPALLKAAQKLKNEYLTWDEPVETATGRDLYEALEAQIGKKEATAVMKGVDIPGIRYLDAGSRGQGGSGTRNFVVFPGEEKKVKILKRE